MRRLCTCVRASGAKASYMWAVGEGQSSDEMLALQMLSPACAGFVLPSASSSLLVAPTMRRAPAPEAGLFDMFQESEAQKAAKEAEWKAQQEMMERRRNPEKMAAYNAEVNSRRAAAASKVRTQPSK